MPTRDRELIFPHLLNIRDLYSNQNENRSFEKHVVNSGLRER